MNIVKEVPDDLLPIMQEFEQKAEQITGKKVKLTMFRVDNSRFAFYDENLIDQITTMVSNEYGVPVADIRGSRRPDRIVEPRHMCCKLLDDLSPYSRMMVGRYFGLRDHSTITSSIQSIQDKIDTEPRVREMYEKLSKKVQEITSTL